jgi:DNA-binding SARP family transcriptional activator/TolB-like protein
MADQGQSGDLLWSSELKLELLGPVRLGNSTGGDFTPKARKTRALLAILALAKGPVPRSRLTDLLWGDRAEDQAKASLRQALYEVRELASGGFISADRESVGLGPKKLPTDMALLQHAIASGKVEEVAEYLQAIDCPLLATLDDITSELDEWLRDERQRLAATIVAASCDVAEAALDRGDVGPARRIADGLERIDALDERVAQLGIRADLATGERTAASRRHARFKARLKDELGVEATPETDRLLSSRSLDVISAVSRHPRNAAGGPPAPSRRGILTIGIALALLLAASIAYILLRPGASAATPTVAVLPFDQADAKENYFAAGVSDEILNLLAHQNRIRVLGRISGEQIGERPNSLDIARKLGVTHLLDGSVRSAGNRLLVIVRLTRVSDGAQLWSERYERRAGDIFAVQADIASSVAARLSRSLGPAVQHATSPEVYSLYLSARQLARERRDMTLAEAEKLLRRAIGIDPNYAPAYADLAQVIMLRSDHPTSYGTIPIAQARAQAERFARKAVALDPSLGDGYAALGFLSLSLDGGSEPYLRKAVELSPQRPDFHRWHAETLMTLGRYDDAVAEYKRAVEIDPLWGLNYDHLIGALYLVGRKAEAKAYADRFFALSTDQRARGLIRLSLQKLNFDLAGELKTAVALANAYPSERQMRLNLAATLAQLGERRRAVALMSEDRRATAAMTGNWAELAGAARGLGAAFWDQSGWWNVAGLLVASGQSQVIAELYERDKPLARGWIESDSNVALPEMIVALRSAGLNADAAKLMTILRSRYERLPDTGLLGEQKAGMAAEVAALSGDREAAIRALDRFSQHYPLDLTHIPAMALRHDPIFSFLAGDPRFLAVEDRIRAAVNAERAKAGLAPISKQAWIGDPKTLLTKN